MNLYVTVDTAALSTKYNSMALSILLSFFLLIGAIQPTVQVSTPDSKSYIAAVVEYAAVGNPEINTPLEIIQQNWKNYHEYIRQASQQNVDIIVFPECGLTTMRLPKKRDEILPWLTEIPDPTTKNIPCNNNSTDVPEILRNISCAAREQQLYIVINLSEKSPCSSRDPKCPDDGAFFYNTNVVFDRNGTIIARYRKFNLFVEPGFDVTPTAELSTFDTDFGVRFGTFICFDLLFQTPAVQLIKQLGITDIAFSTAWFSELPYLTADQIQAAWAYSLDVNLLASGFDNPPNGNSGSGIYSGKLGALDLIMPLHKTSKLLVATVIKKPGRTPVSENTTKDSFSALSEDLPAATPLAEVPTSTIEELRFFQDDFRQYNTVLLDTDVDTSGNNTRHKKIDLCHKNFCCNFEVITESTYEAEGDTCIIGQGRGGYYYRLGVFDGIRNFAGISVAGIQVCGIIPCTKRDDITSCGKSNEIEPKIKVVFKYIRIKGSNFLKSASLQMPVTLMEGALPLPSTFFEFTVKDAIDEYKNEVELQTKKEVNNLIALASYGRVFTRDGPTVQASTTSKASRP